MIVYGGHLYVGTGTIMGVCEIWRFDGISWAPVVGGTSSMPAGFGGNNKDAMSMAVYGTELYAGTMNDTSGCEVWRYDGSSWVQEAGALPTADIGPGFGSAANRRAALSINAVSSLID